MPTRAQHFCSSRNIQVPIRDGLEKCIIENQCFSDDPCPLQAQFDKHSARTEHSEKIQEPLAFSKRQALS